METSSKHIQEIKNFLEKEHLREFSWEEATKIERDLTCLAQLALEVAMEEHRRQKMLEQSPKGFHLDVTGYNCNICDGSASKENSWYDKYGLKCMTCQRAINKKEIPASIAKNKDSWYCKYEFESYFKIKTPVLRKWIKQGLLRARTIAGEGKTVHLQLFLIKDNKEILPPKKLVKGHLIKEIIGEKEWYTSKPWYKFVDPYEHLRGYKIIDLAKEHGIVY